jgi:ATP-dependent protease Clp ATPase subunit
VGDKLIQIVVCSFCGRYNTQVKWLVQGNGNALICDQCSDVCAEIFAERRANESLNPPAPAEEK